MPPATSRAIARHVPMSAASSASGRPLPACSSRAAPSAITTSQSPAAGTESRTLAVFPGRSKASASKRSTSFFSAACVVRGGALVAALIAGQNVPGRLNGETTPLMRFAVVGHAEWAHFLEVPAVPRQGEIVEAGDTWTEAAGGGAVAVVQLARLAGAATFFTAVGSDDAGHRTAEQLRDRGVTVHAALRDEPQRRAVVFLDPDGERTIAVFRRRLHPDGGEELPWAELAETDGVYFTGGDVAALRAARAAKV